MRTSLIVMWLAAFAVTLVVPADAEERAPDFNLRTPVGERIHLKSLLARGPVLLDFWATWCKPCIKMMPKLQEIHETYGERGLTVLGVNEDGPRSQAKVEPFVRARKISFPIVLDSDGGVMKRMRVSALPTSILIDQEGMIVYRLVGTSKGQVKGLIEAIEAALRSSKAASE